ncbi:acyl-CoA dehydrogenase family protein [Streptomyces sp. NPDC058375]|uniref:acyl-CoA dehydrogenase family protein n=1 Tax=Streptomyces sp. NPDC058375 TaxID=3346467 RepID=UPI00365D74E5
MPETPDLRSRVEEALASIGADGTTPARDVWKTLGTAGILSTLYKESTRDDRYGLDPAALRTTLTVLDATLPLASTLSFCVQAATALPLLRDAPPGGPPSDIARQAEEGRCVLALAATDADAAGSDLTAMGTRVETDGDTLVLTGGKRWIVNATTADHALVLARRRPGDHFSNFSLLLVPLTAPGVRADPTDTLWFSGSGVGSLHFDGVRLPTDHIIGSPSRGLAAFTRRITTERLASGLWADALTRRVLAATYRMLTERRIADGPQWAHAAVRHDMAAALLGAQRLQALCDHASAPATDHLTPTVTTAVLKAAGAETLEQVLNMCAQLQGARAFAHTGLHHLRTEAAMFGIAGGTSHTLRELIADHADTLLGVRECPS